MLFTHVLVGLLLGLLVAGPGSQWVVLAGAVGGLLPDLDMVADHRRTLHFPVGFPLAALASAGWWLARPSTLALAATALFAGAAAHSLMDLLGSGRELRPWERVNDDGVYNHVLRRWHRPRRFVYDGSRGDLLIAAATTLPVMALGSRRVRFGAAALLALAAVYATIRRRLAAAIADEFESLSPYLKTRIRAGWRAIRGE